MEGYIITYELKLTSKQITEINYFLFGKVLSKTGKKYYYPGLLDDVIYSRLGNGCYFVITDDAQIVRELQIKDTFKVFRADLHTDVLILQTARNSKRSKYSEVFVKNL